MTDGDDRREQWRESQVATDGGRQPERELDDGTPSTARGGSVGEPTDETFYRSLPVFDSRDRQTVQSLLHYAVATDDEDTEDVEYDHPDRKVARDIYHELREGDAIRLLVGSDLTDVELVVSYENHALDVGTVLETFETICSEKDHEWPTVARDIRAYRRDHLDGTGTEIGFEYRY
jgi:hypothetical protein